MFGLASLWDPRGAERIANGETKYAMAQAVPISPSSFPRPSTLAKRKWNDDVVVGIKCEESPDVKRRKEEIKVALSLPKVPEAEKKPLVVDPKTTPKMPSRLDALRGVLESQLSLEILFKHGELRLINQELAKCQTAYEQLRRCHLIPYPTSKASPFDLLDVSTGTGPAIEPEPGMPRPEWAAPYGVTDGPYTKHYAKWLIPDPRFDGIQPEASFNFRQAGEPMPEGRTTRNSIADGSSSSLRGSMSRTHRASMAQNLQASSSGYPQQKSKDGPCIVKRKDGQSVKLVCLDCNRWDFHSTQGFINHCRIEHKRSYKSHAEAAMSCGQPIELDEGGGIVGEETSPIDPSLVHPLIKSTPTDKESYVNILAHIESCVGRFHRGELPGVASIPSSSQVDAKVKEETKNFVAAPETPFLSDKMRNSGFDGNLEEIVAEAKTKVDLGELSENEEEEEDSDIEKKSMPAINGASRDFVPRLPARSPAPFSRPISSKGLERTAGISPRLAYATPINNTAANHSRLGRSVADMNGGISEGFGQNNDAAATISESPSAFDLSPNTDLPALVSDDDEDDEYNDDDGKSLVSEANDDEGSDIAEISIEDGECAEPTVVHRGGDAARRLKKEEKHVTFVSPVKDATAKKGAGRKR